MQEEFYIGWQAEAPPSFARMVRRSVIALCGVVPLLAVLLAYFQNGFSSGTFEFGKNTELEGIYTENPIPFLTIENGNDALGKPVLQKILLVGVGKSGFTADGRRWTADGKRQDEEGHFVNAEAISGKRVKVSGFLIYNDGKTALQVETIENQEETAADINPSTFYPPPSTFHPPPSTFHPPPSTFHHLSSTVQLRGEITDPKCLLGVMNPGQGKPHRDCAARCIAGGIPPLLKVAGAGGETEYYLLAGPHGEPLNNRILEYVGDGVEVCGRLEQQEDWLMLYVDPNTIQRVNKETLTQGVMCN